MKTKRFAQHASRLRCVVATALCVTFFATSAWADEWNQWRGPNRNGVAPTSPPLLEQLPDDGLKPLWVSDVIPSAREGGWGSPVVDDGKVYLFVHSRTQLEGSKLPPKKYPWLAEDKRGHLTPGEYQEYERKRREEDLLHGQLFEFREMILCVDATSGETLWKNDKESVYTRFLHSGSPAIVDGKLYILAAGRRARCIDARTGDDVWETVLPGEFTDEFMASSFAVADGAAVVLAGHLFGLDAADGTILWEGDKQSTRGTHSSPVVWDSDAGPRIVVNVAGDETICVEPRTGHESWRATTLAGLSTPVIVGNRMVTLGNSRRSGLRCFEITPTSARELWAFQRVADKGGSPVIVGNFVYAQGERRLACVDLETGESQWQTDLDLSSPKYTSLVAADGKVVYAYDGLLAFSADPTDFRPLIAAKFDVSGLMATEATFRRRLGLDELERTPDGLEKSMRLYNSEVGSQGPLQCTSPAIVDGRIFLRLKNGLACYDLTDRKSLLRR